MGNEIGGNGELGRGIADSSMTWGRVRSYHFTLWFDNQRNEGFKMGQMFKIVGSRIKIFTLSKALEKINVNNTECSKRHGTVSLVPVP